MPEALYRASKAHTFVQQGCFFSIIILQLQWAQIFKDFLFYAYVTIHLVRKLVFDNYQRCPVPLTVSRNSGLTVRNVKNVNDWRKSFCGT